VAYKSAVLASLAPLQALYLSFRTTRPHHAWLVSQCLCIVGLQLLYSLQQPAILLSHPDYLDAFLSPVYLLPQLVSVFVSKKQTRDVVQFDGNSGKSEDPLVELPVSNTL
jgi:hypothetical protein